ncbi:Pycsar system effector family protein [Hyphomicrobium sp.]|uniref:Pycsar system effector family protein n=1 Tax=Hyphomicrobium sp. TaxID=82 RepID=UPI000F955EF3|nr:Pycsar system effector family protein [Hyphomicrobium sp.]RUP07943.1 MAG: hypothetical protein EKK38_17520 [Hyphomicrobium sp.]
MDAANEWRSQAASDQLNRILGFFARVENKSNAIFATNTGMLAVLGVHLQWSSLPIWYIVIPAVVGAVLLGVSFVFLYLAASPQTKGGTGSLVYFKEIANRTEADFLAEIKSCSREKYVDQMFAQVWRNAEILTQKFLYVKYAFFCTAGAMLPWLIALTTSSFHYAG